MTNGAGRTRRSFDFWTLILLTALVAGSLLRFWHLTVPGLSHPEIYVPGIDLLPGISEPPARHGFWETLSWHFHDEPHPVGWYMAMWVWTSIAGTSEFALRLPSVLTGIATIWLLWRLGREIFGREAGAIAALLLALNGFHIYWSHWARMYAASAALSVLATWLLVLWMRGGTRWRGLEAGYVIALVAGTQTVELFWAVPFLHLAWVAFVLPGDRPGWRGVLLPWSASTMRIVQVQAIALALAAPEFIHTALHARHGAAPPPYPRFLIEYLGFGFLFETSNLPSGWPDPSLFVASLLAVLALLLTGLGLRASNMPLAAVWPARLPFGVLVLAAGVGAAITLFLASIADRHRAILATFALLPLLCLWLPGLAAVARPTLDRVTPWLTRTLDRVPPFTLLLLLLALIPPPLFYIASIKMSVLASRAFLLFTPFLLLLVAAGLMQLPRSRLLRPLGVAAVVSLFAVSCLYFADRPISPRDYKGIATKLSQKLQPGDVIFVRYRHWQDTPIFYYLHDAHYVTEDHRGWLTRHHPRRVWLIEWWPWDKRGRKDHRREDLTSAGYEDHGFLSAEKARAVLYLPTRAE